MTVQLDGLGRMAADPQVDPTTVSGAQEGSDGPVFVDESGRRSRKFRRVGWVLATVCACYAITLVAALMGGTSKAPWLPIPGLADEKQKADTAEVAPVPDVDPLPSGATPGATTGVSPAGPAGTDPLPPPGKGASSAPAASRPGAAASGTTGPPDRNAPPPAVDPGADPGAATGGTAPGPGTGTGGTGPGTDPAPDPDPAPDRDPGTDPGATTGGTGGTDPGTGTTDPDPAAGGTSAQLALKGP
ncbi:hypothetical protein [Streptomyces sp. A5-4]|uniref:hypothetical protein n=1 Tax=Streptomyces sp. A5-4 TaxID=3384771 RepID=UPI003DA8EE6E